MAQMQSFRLLSEMEEFGSFSAAAQRYIRRSLDVGFNRQDAVARWGRNGAEIAAIEAQAKRYRMIEFIREGAPDGLELDAIESFVGPLITMAAADLGEGKLASFAALRFLYERLIGPAVRPWLPSIFCSAAALPSLHPEQRKRLLGSIRGFEAASPGWSTLEPLFYPEWVDKVPEAVS